MHHRMLMYTSNDPLDNNDWSRFPSEWAFDRFAVYALVAFAKALIVRLPALSKATNRWITLM